MQIKTGILTGLGFAVCTMVQAGSIEIIWSSVVYNYHGERTPLILPVQSVLTPLGAQQLYAVGSFFRDRYVASKMNESNLAINGLSKDELDNAQVSSMSTSGEFIVASAQAFMQGLYPPLNISSRTLLNPMSVLANGSIIDFPLDGYQYPQIYTASPLDPNSIYVAGAFNCPVYDDAAMGYVISQESKQTKSATMGFYNSLEMTVLTGVFEKSEVNYDEAYLIYDYLNYGYTHNQTVKKQLSEADLLRAKALANQWIYATNGKTSATGSETDIRTVSGRTMAVQAIGLLINNIETKGTANKLNILFGSFEPMIAFAALAQLPQANTNFYGLPEYGSSMAFELFSSGSDSTLTYPNTDDLMVRFLFRNGTESTSNLEVYNLFGRNDAQKTLSLKDFLALMHDLTLPSVGDWCNTCQSGNVSIFCASFGNSTLSGSGGSFSIQASHKSNMNPAVAGVIGAIVGLSLVGLMLGLAILAGGVRFYRSKPKRMSKLGGFKAGEKLASDPDLHATNGVGATVVGKDDGRVSSWELREHNHAKETNISSSAIPESTARPSFEADDLDISPSLEPTKIDERV